MASGMEPVPITPQKHDPAWKHCEMFKNGDRVQLKCIYCNKLFKGGGIHRIKEHLAGQKGNASTCLKVPPDVRGLMQQSLDGVVVKKRKRQKPDEDVANINTSYPEVDAFSDQCEMNAGLQLIEVPIPLETDSGLLINHEEGTTSSKSGRKRGRGKSSSATNDAVVIANGVSFGSRKINNQVHMAIGRFLYDIGAPLDAVHSVHFQPMVDAIVSAGPGIAPPSYHDLRGWILKNSVQEVKNDFDKCKATWGRTGCSVLVEQWQTEVGRIMLNFSASCPEGTMFLKSVDATEIISSPDALYELLKKLVEDVGIRHVLQVITTCEDHYIGAVRRLADTYSSLYWAPCAVYCLDMILEDFGNVDWIVAVIGQCKEITRFVYNNSVVLNIVRRFTFGNDILEPGITQAATNFTTLRRMIDLKHNLQAMVTSSEWMDCPYSKNQEGLKMFDIIGNSSFWSSCMLISRLTDPLLRVLRIVNSNKRPAMGYIYAGMYRAKEAIKAELVKREDYMMYWNLIDQRWEQLWHHPLHAAGFYLNPKFFYSIEGDLHSGILSGMFDCIERLVSDTKVQDKIIKEMNVYKNAVGDLGRKMAIRARDTLLPAEWWSTYGGGCPNLSRLAIRILSQSCSLVGCSGNQIPWEKTHGIRNHIESQRLTDLTYVHYNSRLRQKVSHASEQSSVDPISFDGHHIFEDWIWPNDSCSDDGLSLDWTTLDPPPANTMLMGPSNDDTESLGTGFDDYEIFRRRRETEEENTLENAVS